MLLRSLIINRYLLEVQKHPQLHQLLEDAGAMLHAAVRTAKVDREKLEKLDLDELADIITAIKLLTNSDYRQVMTKQDVGIDPNNADQLLKMLDSIPSDPTKALPSSTRNFVRSVALMSKSQRAKELEGLKKLLTGSQTERQQGIVELQKLANQIVQAIERLKAKS
jgi:hypothetical protein